MKKHWQYIVWAARNSQEKALVQLWGLSTPLPSNARGLGIPFFSWKRAVAGDHLCTGKAASSLSSPQLHKWRLPLPGPTLQSTCAKSLLIAIYKIEASKIYRRTQDEVLTLLKAIAKCLKGSSGLQDLAGHRWEEQTTTFVQLQADEKLAIEISHRSPYSPLSYLPFFCPRQSLVFMRESEGSL